MKNIVENDGKIAWKIVWMGRVNDLKNLSYHEKLSKIGWKLTQDMEKFFENHQKLGKNSTKNWKKCEKSQKNLVKILQNYDENE